MIFEQVKIEIDSRKIDWTTAMRILLNKEER